MRDPEPLVRAPRALWVAWALACAVLLALLLTFSFGRDHGIYGIVAERWRRGVWPYEGTWDFKPPGIFLVFVAVQAMLGTGELALRGAEAALLVVLLGAALRHGRDALRSEPIGLLGGVLALLTHVQLDFWHTAQPESFAAPLLFVALELARTRTRIGALALGFLGGLLFLLKPPLGAAAAAAMLAGLSRGAELRVAFRSVSLAAFASLLPVALVALAFHRAGALPALRETLFVFAPGYTKLGWAGETALTLAYRTLERAFTGSSGPIALGIALRLASGRSWAPSRELVAVLAVCMIGTALQAKLFPYHFGAILPLAAMLAAEGYVACFASAGRAGRLAIVGAFVAVFLARGAGRDLQGTFLERCAIRCRAWPSLARGNRSRLDALDKAADLDIGTNRMLADWFRRAARPTEPIFIFGFEPAIYLEAERSPASRYVYDVPLRATWSAEHRTRLLAELRASAPVAIAIERWDRMRMVTGTDADSHEAAHAFPEFMAFLDAHFDKIDDLGRFERWVLRPGEPVTRAPSP